MKTQRLTNTQSLTFLEGLKLKDTNGKRSAKVRISNAISWNLKGDLPSPIKARQIKLRKYEYCPIRNPCSYYRYTIVIDLDQIEKMYI